MYNISITEQQRKMLVILLTASLGNSSAILDTMLRKATDEQAKADAEDKAYQSFADMSELLAKILRAEDNTVTPEKFKEDCQTLFDNYKGDADEEGHVDMDDLLKNTLSALGYNDGIEILNKFKMFGTHKKRR